MPRHSYSLTMDWAPRPGETNADWRSYSRNWQAGMATSGRLKGSSDPAFRGDPARHNPEELFLAAISSCHMLWFLHLAGDAGLVVTGYRDRAEGEMVESGVSGGAFTSVTLRPEVHLAAPPEPGLLDALHDNSHATCFIANSVSVPITVEGTWRLASEANGP